MLNKCTVVFDTFAAEPERFVVRSIMLVDKVGGVGMGNENQTVIK